MIRLVLSDLAGHARVWLGTLAVTIAAGFVAAIAAGLIETGAFHGGRVQEGLGSTSSAVIAFTAVTALIVLSSTANLTVALQQRGYALWQLVGIRPALVGLVVLAQLGIVGILGALIGCLIAMPVFGPLFTWAFREWEHMRGISLHLGIVSVLAVTAAIAVIVLLGGLRGARRAGRTPPIEALRDPEPPRVRMGWLRLLLTAATLIAIVGIAASLNGASFSQISGQSILLTPLIAAVLAAAGPIVFPLVLRAWTALLPARASASWFLARNSARYRLSHSSAAISPLMVAIALTAGLYTTGATLNAAYAAQTGSSEDYGTLAPEGVVILLGGPLLLSAVAAAATVFMSGHARERELALVQAAGSTRAAIVLTAIWEALIYAVTAVLLGTAATVAGGLIVAAALALPFPSVSFAPLGLIAGGGLLLILAATVAPTAAALRHEIPRTLAVE